MKNPKKLLAALLALTLILSLCTGPAQAGTQEMTVKSPAGSRGFFRSSDPHYWITMLDDGTVGIQLDSEYLSTLTSVTIPASIDGMRVSTITSDCFWSGENLTSITLPEGITTIEGRAFDSCTGLKSIMLPASITEIGGPFALNMESISVASDSRAFCAVDGVLYSKDMKTLVAYPLKKGDTSFQIPDGVENIHEYAFYYSQIEQIQLPSSLRTIGDNAFHRCPIETITLPDGLRSIGSEAFAYCENLHQITIPNSVETIGASIFCNCDNLQSVELLGRLTVLPRWTFWDCDSLQQVSIPDSVTYIGESAFAYCYSLQALSIPDSVTGLGESAFEWCYSLDIQISAGLSKLGDLALSGVHSVTVDKNNPAICCVDGVVFSKDMKTLLQYTASSGATSYVVPDGVTEIGAGAFYMASNLQELDIPNSVTKLGQYVFADSGLTKLTLPKGITEIPDYAFYMCFSLQEVTMLGDVTRIGTCAFADGSLPSIDLPDTVTEIGTSAFYNCRYLEQIHLPKNLQTIGQSAFAVCENLKQLDCPFGLAVIRSNAFESCINLRSVTFPATLQSIEYGAFAGCESIQSVNYGGTSLSWSHISFDEENDAVKQAALHCSGIAHSDDQFYYVQQPGINELYLYALSDKAHSRSSITVPAVFDGIPVGYIGANVFSGCNDLTSVTISEGIKAIGNNAFSDCVHLQSVSLPDSVICILDQAFLNCYELQDITLPSRMVELGYGAFYECQSLARICIPEGITDIRTETFYDCASLSEVVFPETLKTIAFVAFQGCTSLTKLEFPEGLSFIDDYAFAYCYRLTHVRLPESLKELHDSAFMYCDSLRWAYVPADIRYFGYDAFYNDGILRDLYYGGTKDQWGNTGFNLPGLSAIDANIHYNSVPAVGQFLDVRASDWFCDSVAYAYEKGLMNGTGEHIFSPNGSLTRAQLVTILYRMKGAPEVSFQSTFSDVASGTWYSNAIEWAAANGIVNGYTDGTFKPNAKITREQIATILYRLEGLPEASGTLSFPDAGTVSDYAVDAMRWAVSEGLINGVASGGVTNLAPKNTATRAQIAAIIMRYQEGNT